MGFDQDILTAVNDMANGRQVDLTTLGAQVSKYGSYLFASAESDFAPALDLLARASYVGLDIRSSGLGISDLPSPYDIETATNALMRANFDLANVVTGGGAVMPAGSVYSCDEYWCSYFGYAKMRFLQPNDAQCVAAGSDRATCRFTLRIKLFVDMSMFGGGTPLTDLTSALMNVSSMRGVPAEATLVRSGTVWSVEGSIETNPS